MKHSFPPLVDARGLPARVLCVAPHPDDEVIGCGGMLAFHAARGDAVRVAILTDGAGPHGSRELAAGREAESRAACRLLGVEDVRFLGLADGGLEREEGLAERLAGLVADFGPELVYAPAPSEHHPDHRAASAAVTRALAGAGCRVLLYGVNAPVPRQVLFDTSAQWAQKRAALECFTSQTERHDLLDKVEALDRGRTINVDQRDVRCAEGFADLASEELASFARSVAPWARAAAPRGDWPRATAVISSFNKKEDVRANLAAVFRQTLPFDSVVVVDNASSDGTPEMVRAEFPAAHLIVMPHSRYGACETFNVGFANSRTPLTAILDDDIVMPPEWLERATARLMAEPPTTAILSTKVVEPGMPESYKASPAVNSERYMSTFRGCASLARTSALREAGYYDERLFIYGNERDLTCRLLNLGYRVLQYPGVEVFHRTPFGIKPGQRSLYYHARNAWLTMLKYAPAADLARLPWLVLRRVVLRSRRAEEAGAVTDAVGTIGVGASLRETPGAWWIVLKALFSVIYNVPYCLRHRRPVRADDFELPIR